MTSDKSVIATFNGSLLLKASVTQHKQTQQMPHQVLNLRNVGIYF